MLKDEAETGDGKPAEPRGHHIAPDTPDTPNSPDQNYFFEEEIAIKIVMGPADRPHPRESRCEAVLRDEAFLRDGFPFDRLTSPGKASPARQLSYAASSVREEGTRATRVSTPAISLSAPVAVMYTAPSPC